MYIEFVLFGQNVFSSKIWAQKYGKYNFFVGKKHNHQLKTYGDVSFSTKFEMMWKSHKKLNLTSYKNS